MIDFVLLCGGPVSKDRCRHLEFVSIEMHMTGRPIIGRLLEEAKKISSSTTHIAVYEHNYPLIEYLKKNYPKVTRIDVTSTDMLATLKSVYENTTRDVVLCDGDLIKITGEQMSQMVENSSSSAISHYEVPWKEGHLVSPCGTLIRRSDLGTVMVKLSRNDFAKFLDIENQEQAKLYFEKFYPNQKFSNELSNHLYTWLVYTFFNKISSERGDIFSLIDEYVGFESFKGDIWADND